MLAISLSKKLTTLFANCLDFFFSSSLASFYYIFVKSTIGLSRDLSIMGLFLFMIPRIFNTKNDTIQYQKTIPTKKKFFLILLHFLPFQTILSIFWKSPFLGPKMAHIMGFWAENHLFRVFSFKCLELSNSSRNEIKIQSWIFLNILE